MPGGRAAVYSSILRYTQDDTGMDVVLGHEVGHAMEDIIRKLPEALQYYNASRS
jgi:Zn-dependent protease with chaperone function